LHAEAQAEIRHFVLSGKLSRANHALNPAIAEPARHDDAMQAFETPLPLDIVLFE
jgi:hypothetical protein